MGKKFFDDRIFLCKKTNQLWIGRPDYKYQGQPWTWFLFNGKTVLRSTKIPNFLIEVIRVPEYSVC